MNTFNKYCLSFYFFCFSHSALAVGSDVDLGSSGSSFFRGITKAMQDIVDFLGGPGVLFIVFISVVLAVGLWIAAPKAASAAVGWLMRIIVGGIVVLNAALVISYLQSLA